MQINLKNKSKKLLKRERWGAGDKGQCQNTALVYIQEIRGSVQNKNAKKSVALCFTRYKCPVNTVNKLNIVMITVFLTHIHQ